MKKPFMIILIVCSAVFVVAAIINENPDKIPKAKNAVKPIQKRAAPPKPWSPTPAKSTESMTFPKHLISLEEVKKHPELHTEQEQLAYWYRYNQSAAGYHHRKRKWRKRIIRDSCHTNPRLVKHGSMK